MQNSDACKFFVYFYIIGENLFRKKGKEEEEGEIKIKFIKIKTKKPIWFCFVFKTEKNNNERTNEEKKRLITKQITEI